MTAKTNNRALKGLDLVIDFATLGEYRVVTDRPRRAVAEADLWATDIDWTQPERRREMPCRLPRIRERATSMQRVRS